ncbi:glycosyltransferase [Lacticaseibacillus rhamnosus]|uniref:glycosyltransferase n=1 Tax=Lacticaseibacillus rhamnosus TaxID=47715 RepID=UPI003DA7FEE8
MKVLHYFLGWPPFRSGGLTQYAVDLMHEQYRQKDKVYALFPAYGVLRNFKAISSLGHKFNSEVITFSLNKSEPLPLQGSIRTPRDFMKSGNLKEYVKFLKNLHPEIVHFHTLMGLPREFLMACNQLGIKTFFTSHDYFGISPNPKFVYRAQDFSEKNSSKMWENCSTTSFSVFKLRLYQAPVYPLIRHFLSPFKKVLSGGVKTTRLSENSGHGKIAIDDIRSFHMLRDYYLNMFSMIDHFIFNSDVAKNVYLRNLGYSPKYDIVPVTTLDVDFRKHRFELSLYKSDKPFRIGYIGPYTEEKGFQILVNAVHDIPSQNIELHLWGDDVHVEKNSPNVTNHGRFKHKEISKVFKTFDLLIIPSVWKETFGLVALESISNNTPVVVSSRAGSSMLVDKVFKFDPTQKGIYRWLSDYLSHNIPKKQTIEIPESLSSMRSQALKIQEIYIKELKA